VVAAGRAEVRDKVAFVASLGGHGRLERVMRYLATGDAPEVPGLDSEPPHDYGVAVILYALADRGVVPPAQVQALRAAIETFLLASTLTATDMTAAGRTFARARDLAAELPEPARTYMAYVNERAVAKLKPLVAPHLDDLPLDAPSLSPELAPAPHAPVYLLHGQRDTIIPAAESVLLADDLRRRGAAVRLLLTSLITHAQVSGSASAADVWDLISFWADILRR